MTGKASPDEYVGGKKPDAEPTAAPSKKTATEFLQTTDFLPKELVESSADLTPLTVPEIADCPETSGPSALESASPELRYAIGPLHAEGGIGQVWRARDQQLNRDVAIKKLRPELLRLCRARRRFLLEAQITGQLEHPGIIPVHELIETPQSGEPFYSMRFVHGRSLAEASRVYHQRRQAGDDEPHGLVSLLSAFVTVCNTVAYAHSRGVVHRDLKGDNVLLGNFGEVFVLDWGVAKLLDAAEHDIDAPLENQLSDSAVYQTIQGQVVGTPAYMAPEQADGRLDRIDRRTDIYGLGSILYEILTGRPPFSGSSTVEVLAKVQNDAPLAPRQVWPEAPQSLEAACLRALSKDPDDRHASAAELGREIQTWQEVQRRRVEEELRRSRERFELAVHGSQDGLWDWDLQRNEVFFSPRWKSMIGYEDHELPNDLDEWVRRLHPDDRDHVMAANYAHINGTTLHYEYEYRLRHKDGSYRWILSRGVALRNPDGKAYRMAGSHVDITARKQMEQTLLEAEHRYRTVVESAPYGILTVDVDGVIRECNAQAAQMLGIPVDQLAGVSLLELGHHAVREDGMTLDNSMIREFLRADAEQRHRRFILQLHGNNGNESRVSFESHPVNPQSSTDSSDTVIFLQRE